MAEVVHVPGVGQVAVRDTGAISVRARRVVQVHMGALGLYRLAQIATSGLVAYDDLEREIGLTVQERELLDRIGAAVTLALVESWDLPSPVPATVEEFLGLPEPVRDALQEATRKPGARILEGVR
jgi:hypothetical protein